MDLSDCAFQVLTPLGYAVVGTRVIRLGAERLEALSLGIPWPAFCAAGPYRRGLAGPSPATPQAG